ncbi:MAG: hypothetical protein OXH96_06990 [Spirochaetaceae bacterium]|nr:hypothetical protein [Spirochaetaceae bacterium]
MRRYSLTDYTVTLLGFIGLQRPVLSWGVLQNAHNVRTTAVHPWLIPVLFVIAAVLQFNFVGDGLRDAADPYKR